LTQLLLAVCGALSQAEIQSNSRCRRLTSEISRPAVEYATLLRAGLPRNVA
jgi:hypothetical protein